MGAVTRWIPVTEPVETLDARQVAALIGVHTYSVYGLVRVGRLPAPEYRQSGKKLWSRDQFAVKEA